MKLKKLGPNMTTLELASGNTVLFSYETPVAYHNAINGLYFRTAKKWSVTTSKHINKWLGSDRSKCGEVAQSFLDELVGE